MALADYYLCDVCGSKTFYDAHLQYFDPNDEKELQLENPRNNHKYIPLGAGDMRVICHGCAKTHKVVIATSEVR